MRKNIRFIVIAIASVILSCALLSCFTTIFENKTSGVKYDEFLIESENFDVLFCGSSHMIEGVYPMELWERYGITSYNLGNHASQIPVSYYTLLNALDYTSPKVVVLDLYTIGYQSKLSDNLSYLHTAMDAFPVTKNKVLAVNDLCDGLEDKLGFLFPVVAFHNNWASLYGDNFKHYAHKTYKRGAEEYYSIKFDLTFPGTPDKDARISDRTISMDYLDKFIELCNERDINVVLVTLPCMQDINSLAANNYAYDVIQRFDNVKYLNLMAEDIVDYRFDFMDEAGHLNYSGAVKITSYLGDYLTNNYELNDYRENDSFGSWIGDYEKYLSIINNDLVKSTNIYEQLLILSDQNYKCRLVMKNDWYKNNPNIMCMLNNLYEYELIEDSNLDRDCMIEVIVGDEETLCNCSYIVKDDGTIVRID